MHRGTAVLLTAVTGGLSAMQAPINSGLGRAIGTFQAALVSFAIGTLALVALAANGGLGAIGGVRGVPWHPLVGGLPGAVHVTTVLVTVPTLGAGGITAATISGQLAMSVAVDRFGWLGIAATRSAPGSCSAWRCSAPRPT